MDFLAPCPAPPRTSLRGLAVEFEHRARLHGGAAAWLRALVLRLLATLALVAFSVQAVDPQRILASAQQYGPTAISNAKGLLEVMASLSGRDDATRLKVVNDFYNQRLAYMEDIDNWGLVDYWASPLESLGKGAGDCEDYAIGKYFTLLAAGVPESSLRLVYVRADLPGSSSPVAHMVLAHYANPNADPSILDNLVRSVQPASTRRDLTPVFSFNGAGLWQGGAAASSGDPQARLSPWRDVVAKAHAEGF